MRSNRLALFESSPITPLSPVSDNNKRSLPEEILLLRYGSNSYTRNGVSGEILFTEEDAENLLGDFRKRARDLVIDYEHQSLSGEKAPAAGWISALEKTQEGLLARIKYWTKEAEEFLLKGEYRYFSPTLLFSRKGKTLSAIHSVALTNHPAMHGIDPLTAGDLALSAGEDLSERQEEKAGFTYPETENSNETKGEFMDEILEKAGLLSLASSDAVTRKEALLSHLTALQEKAETAEAFLEKHHFASFHEASSELENAALLHRKEMFREAFSEGKLTENMLPWAEAFADAAPELFRKWLENAPRIVPGNEVPKPFSSSYEKCSSFSGEEEKIFAMLGLTPREVGKTLDDLSGTGRTL